MIFSVFQKIWVFGYSWSTLLWYRCYYPHRSRVALSPVCGIFFFQTRHFVYLQALLLGKKCETNISPETNIYKRFTFCFNTSLTSKTVTVSPLASARYSQVLTGTLQICQVLWKLTSTLQTCPILGNLTVTRQTCLGQLTDPLQTWQWVGLLSRMNGKHT